MKNTKGKVEFIGDEMGFSLYAVGDDNSNGQDIAQFRGNDADENVRLCSEAFNVANETGKTPRQLAKEIETLTDLLRSIGRYHGALEHLPISTTKAIKKATE